MDSTTPERLPQVLQGSAKDMAKQLQSMSDRRVVTITLPDSWIDAPAMESFIARVVPLASRRMADLNGSYFDALVEALVHPVPLTEQRQREASMEADARNAVLDSAQWLTAAEVSARAGLSQTNPSAQPNRWKREGKIFAIQQGGKDFYPAYGLDPDDRFRPVKGMAHVIQTLHPMKSDWGLAYWFASVNGFLGGERPQDLIATQPECVLAAAADEAAGVVHG